MTRADRKNAVLRKTRLKFQQPLAGRPLVRNYEALSKTHYNSVYFGLKFLQYILNILHFQISKKKKFRFFQPKLPDYYLKFIQVSCPAIFASLVLREKNQLINKRKNGARKQSEIFHVERR